MREVPPARPNGLIGAVHTLLSGGILGVAIRVSRGFGDLMKRIPYTDDELLVSLGNSLKFHQQSVRQRQSFFGRLSAIASRTPFAPDSIEIDGIRLQQLFALARTDPPASVAPSKIYALDIEMFRSLLKAATEHANERRSKAV